jgi:hypothetical protein
MTNGLGADHDEDDDEEGGGCASCCWFGLVSPVERCGRPTVDGAGVVPALATVALPGV